MLVAVAASAMTMMALNVVAQAPPGGGPGRGMGQLDRAGLSQRLALDADGLNLTADQKGRIDKILDAYIADQTKMRAQMQPGSPPSQEVMGAMRTAREKLNTDVGAVLNDGQTKTWEAAMAARPRGPGGGGGPPPGR
jgi:Spy/CpxP family protein refolding chaperone